MPAGPHRPAPDGAGRQRDRQAQRNTDGPSVLLYEHRWAIGVHLRMCRRHGAGRIQRGAAAARPTAARPTAARPTAARAATGRLTLAGSELDDHRDDPGAAPVVLVDPTPHRA